MQWHNLSIHVNVLMFRSYPHPPHHNHLTSHHTHLTTPTSHLITPTSPHPPHHIHLITSTSSHPPHHIHLITSTSSHPHLLFTESLAFIEVCLHSLVRLLQHALNGGLQPSDVLFINPLLLCGLWWALKRRRCIGLNNCATS